jgi:hypothetical protein
VGGLKEGKSGKEGRSDQSSQRPSPMVRLHGNKFAVYAKEPTRGSSALKKLRRSLTAEGREGRRRRWESSHSIHSDTRPVKKCGQPIFFCET